MDPKQRAIGIAAWARQSRGTMAMSDSSGSKEARFCPNCGRKVTGAAEKFNEPQVCPACKQRVLFYSHEARLPPLDDVSGVGDVRGLSKFTGRMAIVAGALLAVALLLLAIGALTGIQFLALFAAFIGIAAGIAGFAILMEQKQRIDRMRDAYADAATRLHEAAAKNGTIVNSYHALKTHFDQIVLDAKKAKEEEYTTLLEQANMDATEAAQRLEAISDLEADVNSRVHRVVQRFLKDTRQNLKSKLTVNNFAASRERFLKAVEFCRKHGCEVDDTDVEQFLHDLKEDFEELVRVQARKEQQALIKEKIREEERARREIERELKRAAAEREAIENAIAEALAKAVDEHSAEVELLREKLTEAEARSARAMSMAQQTKAGNVYVISNIGSFGESVFKIGMTRRLEPLDRVKELGDASVPFPFDVHMMIYSEDAPALEAALHRKFNHQRVNRINLRKEFFQVELEDIVEEAKKEAGEVEYVAEPDAFEYRESMMMTDEDVDLVASAVNPETLAEE